MATKVILPALGMAQETGKVVQWLKAEGEQVIKGQPIAEIETDKARVELEAPANGILTNLTAAAGDEIPVGQTIAIILAPHEATQRNKSEIFQLPSSRHEHGPQLEPMMLAPNPTVAPASRLASRIAHEHQLDLSLVTPTGKRIQKADVLAYLHDQQRELATSDNTGPTRASPKARRLALEQEKDIATIKGTGP
ncbi:MAG: hypothetical protein JOZ18_00810, partial [Chloroflexi bacterium]|nr:hypothetical protein [Chloroflexota bacterium]